MIKPLISIIVPVYNGEQYIRQSIESITAQSYDNLELIIVNDGSTDSTLTICQEYKLSDKRITIITTSNKGVSSARNTGLDNVVGSYIGFVDSDDYIDKYMYEKLVEVITKNNADIAECGYIYVNDNGEELYKKDLTNSLVEGSYNCSHHYVTLNNTFNFNCNKLYSKDLIGDIRYPQLAYSEDFVFNVKAFYRCNRKVSISGYYYYYRKNHLSATMKPFTEKKLEMITAGKSMIKFHEDKYPDLIPYIVIYVLKQIISIHEDILMNGVGNNKYLKIIQIEFKNLYNSLPPKIVQRNNKGVWLYHKSPNIYFKVSKLLEFLQ